MKPSELLRACAESLAIREQYDLGLDAHISLVWPKGSKGRFPFRGHLACVNNAEDRVYHVHITSVLDYVSRTLKADRSVLQQKGESDG